MKKNILMFTMITVFVFLGIADNSSLSDEDKKYLQDDLIFSSERQIPGVFSESELLSFAVKEFKKWTFWGVGELGRDRLTPDIARIGKPIIVRKYNSYLEMDVNKLYYFYVPVFYNNGSLATAKIFSPFFDRDIGDWSVSSSTGMGNIMMNTSYIIHSKDAKKYLEDYLSIKIKQEPIAIKHSFGIYNFRSHNWFWYFHFDNPIQINGVDIYNIFMNPFIDNRTETDPKSKFMYKPWKGSLKDITLEEIFSEQTSQGTHAFLNQRIFTSDQNVNLYDFYDEIESKRNARFLEIEKKRGINQAELFEKMLEDRTESMENVKEMELIEIMKY